VAPFSPTPDARPPTPTPALALATWFGCGYAPAAPGTVGSLGAVAVAWVLAGPLGLAPVWLAVAAAVLFLPAVWASNHACQHWQTKDPQKVVVDEVLGQWITLAVTPAVEWRSWLAAFALFRLFDIFKPFPARQAERFPRGWGVIADDLVAGLYGAIVLSSLRWLHYL
jgi:phosphatidylglycerophosphatase A